MFYVTKKSDSLIQKVYDIQYKNGYPFFLLYENNQWITRSAKHYLPTQINERLYKPDVDIDIKKISKEKFVEIIEKYCNVEPMGLPLTFNEIKEVMSKVNQ